MDLMAENVVISAFPPFGTAWNSAAGTKSMTKAVCYFHGFFGFRFYFHGSID